MAEIHIEPYEQALIDRYSFKVTTAGDRFVVRDPKIPKKKHEGGSLHAMLCRAEEDRIAFDAKANGTAAPDKTAAPKPAKQPASRAKQEPSGALPATAPKPEVAVTQKPEDATPLVAAPTVPERTPRAKRATSTIKRGDDPVNWRTGQVGMLILRNPEKTPEDILKMCEAAGIETKFMTVVGLVRYFRLAVRLLTVIAEEDAKRA